jgi:hypothetical protein
MDLEIAFRIIWFVGIGFGIYILGEERISWYGAFLLLFALLTHIAVETSRGQGKRKRKLLEHGDEVSDLETS